MEVKPIRIQRKRTKGWRLPPNTVVITRKTPYGNPAVVSRRRVLRQHYEWTVHLHGKTLFVGTKRDAQAFAVKVYRETMTPARRAFIRANLIGRDVACYCSPEDPCHGDVVIEIANGPICEEVSL